MNNLQRKLGLSLSAVALAVTASQVQAEDSLAKAIKNGKTTLDFNLRYETVDQDNALEDADALTLRTRLTYKSAATNGFSFLVEAEDVRSVMGIDDYSVPPSGFNTGVYSVIADPKSTELDQAFVQYSNVKTTARFGRQVIALDNHRHVGHVGWRQDRQTFDAISLVHKFNKQLTARYYFINQRNRIFADDADLDSEDHLVNVSYKSDIGTLTGYAYLLEVDNNTDNSLDTYGIRFAGNQKIDSVRLFYQLEYATQTSETLGNEFDANYWLLEGGVGYNGHKLTLGLENLGSDNGAYGFSTPLATLHKFNGWADIFLGTPGNGLQDLYIKLQGKLMGGKYHIVWHDFSADENVAGLDDYGTELELQYTYAFNKNYSVGLKYSGYSADDYAVDTDKTWLWFGAKF
ncbi:alginate export family protein [Planctobacterium marinum]|uniref:Alginate export domain-containing protein n=1 Tax=Planctobacterium marinum TaxID=1631968 RepID=A0AA48KS90_9ALTE|nr:hypothetical protein MACH26_24080 [Planctobacterium marinum]